MLGLTLTLNAGAESELSEKKLLADLLAGLESHFGGGARFHYLGTVDEALLYQLSIPKHLCDKQLTLAYVLETCESILSHHPSIITFTLHWQKWKPSMLNSLLLTLNGICGQVR
jgi:hypothetical protein